MKNNIFEQLTALLLVFLWLFSPGVEGIRNLLFEGEKFNEFYKYLETPYGRPVYTHEIPFLDIQEKSKEDFIALCKGDSDE